MNRSSMEPSPERSLMEPSPTNRPEPSWSGVGTPTEGARPEQERGPDQAPTNQSRRFSWAGQILVPLSNRKSGTRRRRANSAESPSNRSSRGAHSRRPDSANPAFTSAST